MKAALSLLALSASAFAAIDPRGGDYNKGGDYCKPTTVYVDKPTTKYETKYETKYVDKPYTKYETKYVDKPTT